MPAFAVIGAGYGDEGKGLMTDFLASQSDKGVVIRSNGGAQAGHTVETPDGRRHVFHHFGSASFLGWPTFLSEFFVSNPLLFAKELNNLSQMGVWPSVSVDPASPVTTPYDMLINQKVEESRGAARHGSCGVGFGETLERSERDARYRITVGDLHSEDDLIKKIGLIIGEYVPVRFAELGLDIDESTRQIIESEILKANFVHACMDFAGFVKIIPVEDISTGQTIIFEGAQGLELDQTIGLFPHVTRSNTGLFNVMTLAEKLGLSDIEAVYMTRAYKTRHGAGGLPHELADKPWSGIVDETNKPHEFQGTLRFGWLDADRLGEIIQADVALAQAKNLNGIDVKVSLGITCLDQVDGLYKFVRSGELASGDMEFLVSSCAAIVHPSNIWLSFGPTRRTTEVFKL